MKNNFLDTFWKVNNELKRIIIIPFIEVIFLLNNLQRPKGYKIFGFPIIQKHRKSYMQFGKNLQLRSTPESNPLGANHPVILCTLQPDARLEIGDFFGMTGGTICAANHISIGDHVIVGANSTIVDTDFHPLDPVNRKIHPANAHSAPIVIKDNVFIGMNCLILKGVTIGQDSVIGAGSVVTHDIPQGVIAAGNPARVIKEIPGN